MAGNVAHAPRAAPDLGVDFLDTETSRFRPGCMAPPLACVQIAEGEHGEPFLLHWSDPAIPEYLRYWHRTGRRVAGARLAYDMAVLCAHSEECLDLVFGLYDRGLCSDVMIRQRLLDIAHGAQGEFHNGKFRKYDDSLAGLARRHFNVHMDKNTWRLGYEGLRHLPLEQWPDGAITYALDDVDITRSVWLHTEYAAQTCRFDNVLADEVARARVDFALQLVSVWGIRTDTPGVEGLAAACSKKMTELRGALEAEGLLRPSGVRNIAAARKRMVAAMGGVVDDCKQTKTGKKLDVMSIDYVALDEDACLASGDPVLVDYSRYTSLSTLQNGHLKAMHDGLEYPIHSRFDAVKNTGRTGSSNPNIQNLGQGVLTSDDGKTWGVRECFVPRPGNVILTSDLERAELHTLAQVCLTRIGWSTLADALNGGTDPHVLVGSQLLRVSYDELKRLIQEDFEPAKRARQAGKPANFGFAGGMKAKGMRAYAQAQYGITLTLDEAENLYAVWRDTWPCVVEYLQWIHALCGGTFGGLCDVQHLVTGRWRGRIPYTVAANTHFQGLCADGALAVVYEIIRRCYHVRSSALYGWRMINFVHDEFVLEGPEESLHEASEELRAVVTEVFNRYVPDVPGRCSLAAMRRFSKRAKPYYVNGRLAPYEDAPRKAA